MKHSSYQIITPGDYRAMYELSKIAGWNQTLADLSKLTKANQQYHLGAVVDSQDSQDGQHQVGSGLVISLGDHLAWIGMILVDPNYRRLGIASSLMRECLLAARLQGNHPVVGLDATPAGNLVYQRLGFKPSFTYWRSVVSTSDSASVNPSLIITYPEQPILLPLRWGLDNKPLWIELMRQLYPEGCWISLLDNKINGLVMTRPGKLKPLVGPLLADSLTVAKALLHKCMDYWQQKGHEEVFIDIPENHFHSASKWEQDKLIAPPAKCTLHPEISPDRTLLRMYQLVSDVEYQEIQSKKSPDAEFAKIMQHAATSYQQTAAFIEKEQATLNYLFATGGPEVG